jgi:hypothetical protein
MTEFIAACNVGRMSLFIRSILWDLDIPQEAATIAYEDNDGCTAMASTQNQQLEHDTSTSNTLSYATGSSVTLFT